MKLNNTVSLCSWVVWMAEQSEEKDLDGLPKRSSLGRRSSAKRIGRNLGNLSFVDITTMQEVDICLDSPEPIESTKPIESIKPIEPVGILPKPLSQPAVRVFNRPLFIDEDYQGHSVSATPLPPPKVPSPDWDARPRSSSHHIIPERVTKPLPPIPVNTNPPNTQLMSPLRTRADEQEVNIATSLIVPEESERSAQTLGNAHVHLIHSYSASVSDSSRAIELKGDMHLTLQSTPPVPVRAHQLVNSAPPVVADQLDAKLSDEIESKPAGWVLKHMCRLCLQLEAGQTIRRDGFGIKATFGHWGWSHSEEKFSPVWSGQLLYLRADNGDFLAVIGNTITLATFEQAEPFVVRFDEDGLIVLMRRDGSAIGLSSDSGLIVTSIANASRMKVILKAALYAINGRFICAAPGTSHIRATSAHAMTFETFRFVCDSDGFRIRNTSKRYWTSNDNSIESTGLLHSEDATTFKIRYEGESFFSIATTADGKYASIGANAVLVLHDGPLLPETLFRIIPLAADRRDLSLMYRRMQQSPVTVRFMPSDDVCHTHSAHELHRRVLLRTVEVSKNVTVLPGESIVATFPSVTDLLDWTSIVGTLVLTNYQLLFVPDIPEQFVSFI